MSSSSAKSSPSILASSAPSAEDSTKQAPPSASPPDADDESTSQKTQYVNVEIDKAPLQVPQLAPRESMPQDPPVKKKRTWKKPAGKPKRPLSAYNLFFQEEREKIVAFKRAQAAKQAAKEGRIPTAFINNRPVDANGKKRKKLPSEKIGFAALAREIADKWKKLDAKSKAPFEARAMKDKDRYEVELSKWNEQEILKKQQKLEAPVDQQPKQIIETASGDAFEKFKEAERLAAARAAVAIGANSQSSKDASMIVAAFKSGVNAVASSSSSIPAVAHLRQHGVQQPTPTPNKPASLPDNPTSAAQVQLTNLPPPTHYQAEKGGPLLPITANPTAPQSEWKRRLSDVAVARRASMPPPSVAAGGRQASLTERRGSGFMTGRRGGLMPNSFNNGVASHVEGPGGAPPSPYNSTSLPSCQRQAIPHRRASRSSVTFSKRLSTCDGGDELSFTSSSSAKNNHDNNNNIHRISFHSASSGPLLPSDYIDDDETETQDENKANTTNEKMERKRGSIISFGPDDEGELGEETELNEEKVCSPPLVKKQKRPSSLLSEHRIHPALNRALIALSGDQEQIEARKQKQPMTPASLPSVSLTTLATLAGSAAQPATPSHVPSSSSVYPTSTSSTSHRTGSETIIKVLNAIGGTFHASCHSGASKEIFNDIKKLDPHTPIENIPFHLLITKLSTRIVELEEKSMRLEKDNIELARMLAQKRKWDDQSGNQNDDNDVIELDS